MSATPTGSLTRRGDRDLLTWERTFDRPIEHVWAAITESDRLGRWIGTWTGDPAAGHVLFTMTAEGEDVAAQRWDVPECDRPRLLRVESVDEYGSWLISLALAESAGVTTLTMTQVVLDVAGVENVGPGWEYYLDRLVVAETGGDPASVVWDDYYPAQREHYLRLAETLEPGIRERLDAPRPDAP